MQDYIVFTYDDFQAGQASMGPTCRRRSTSSASARRGGSSREYHDPAGTVRAEWEMYDLKTDPLETTNIARPGYRRTPAQNAQLTRLRQKLANVRATRLQPL